MFGDEEIEVGMFVWRRANALKEIAGGCVGSEHVRHRRNGRRVLAHRQQASARKKAEA
jgi:hypothetical protein